MFRLLESSWAPYCLPYFGFLLVVQFGGAAAIQLPLRVAVPLGFLLYFARRGRYAELRGFRPDPLRLTLDIVVGVVGALVWVAPFLLWPSWRPAAETAFDASQWGASWAWLTLALRFAGFALVTPFMEELFIRSWLQRTVESLGKSEGDFRRGPIARFTLRSFIVVVLWFTFSHARWEWPVAAAWILLTQAWFYHRKHLLPLVISHTVSNVAIFLFVLLGDQRISDLQGNMVSLWVFL